MKTALEPREERRSRSVEWVRDNLDKAKLVNKSEDAESVLEMISDMDISFVPPMRNVLGSQEA